MPRILSKAIRMELKKNKDAVMANQINLREVSSKKEGVLDEGMIKLQKN
jgi:hypothetical protein